MHEKDQSQRHHQRDRHRGDAVQVAEYQILIGMQILAEHNADGGNAGEAHPGAHFLHHVQAGAEGQPETNQRHHQDHVVAEIIDDQLHHQNIETGQHHPDDAPDRADHRPTIVHRKQDQDPGHQRRQRVTEIADLEHHKDDRRDRTGEQRLVANAGGVFFNARRRLARFDVRDQVMQQRAQRHRQHAGFHIGEHQGVPVAGRVAHKVEHRALAHHPHRPQQKQRPLAHKAKTHHVQGEHHQGHDHRPLRQITDDQYHFDAVHRRAEHKLAGDMAVEHRHQRHQHQRINHEKHTVLHVVEGGDAERNRPGHGDTHRLAKIIRRVDDIAVRGKDVRQGINRHSATSSPGGSAGRQRCGRKVLRYCTVAP